MSDKEKEVLDLIIEERGESGIDKYISSLPKGKQKNTALDLMTKLQNDLSSILIDQRLAEVKIKKLNDKIKNTDPMKALKQMKADVKKMKKETEKLALVLLGCKKMAAVLGIDMPNIKAILED